MRVLVTNAKNRIAYNIVRSLANSGIEVYCADFALGAMSFYSKYSSGHFVYPSPFSAQEKFIKCLIGKIKDLGIDVLIPVYEESFLISKYKSEISNHVKVAIPDYRQILIAHNKHHWEPIARKLGVPVPRTFALVDLLESPECISALPFPLLIKPKQGGGGWGIRRIDSAKELRLFLRADSHEGYSLERFFAQEWIDGHVHCVAMVFCHGELRGKIGYRQIREYPAFGGQATCRVSCTNPFAEDNLLKLLQNLNWHGVCQADFLVDSVSGVPYLIDINPRFWGSLAQGIASGVDFSQLIFQIALNGDATPVEGFKEGVVTRWLGGEMRGFPQNFYSAQDKISFIQDFLNSRPRTSLWDDISLRDPLPFLAWGLDSMLRVVTYGKARPHDALDGVWE